MWSYSAQFRQAAASTLQAARANATARARDRERERERERKREKERERERERERGEGEGERGRERESEREGGGGVGKQDYHRVLQHHLVTQPFGQSTHLLNSVIITVQQATHTMQILYHDSRLVYLYALCSTTISDKAFFPLGVTSRTTPKVPRPTTAVHWTQVRNSGS